MKPKKRPDEGNPIFAGLHLLHDLSGLALRYPDYAEPIQNLIHEVLGKFTTARKLQAIVDYRRQSGVSLKEAKDIIEFIGARLGKGYMFDLEGYVSEGNGEGGHDLTGTGQHPR